MGSIASWAADQEDKHEREQTSQALPFLEKLQEVKASDVTIGDLSVILNLKPDTYHRRRIIKQLYEKYIGPTDWAPKADAW